MDENQITGRVPDIDKDLLMDPVLMDDILADDAAMSAAGLTSPEHASTDRIIEEARDLSAPTGNTDRLFRDQEYTDTFGGGEDLERVFSDEPYVPQEGEDNMTGEIPTEAQEQPAQPPRKGRPKRKKGAGLLGIPHILATAVWLLIVVMLGVSLGRLIWVCASDLLAFGREEQEIVVSIEDSDTIEDIAVKLKDAGLIRYTQLFEMYAELSDAREKISSGTYTLNTIYDYNALVNSMTFRSSTKEEVKVTIPEGYTCAQIFALLEENGVCTAQQLEEYAAYGELDEYWFLEGVERGTAYCLEGFLFPDTYHFYMNDEPESVLEKMLDDFDYRLGDELKTQLDTLNASLPSDLQMDWRDVVIVASLIEKEVGTTGHADIAAVIYNRLTTNVTNGYLQFDSAIQYARELEGLERKADLTYEDLEIDSEYNTYLHKGLPAGPIANPGLASIQAALAPSGADYTYFLMDNDGVVHFYSTYEAFLEGKATYLGG